MSEPVYRPVAGLAIAGLVLAILNAVAVTALALTAWFSGTPLLWPWLLALPVAAALVSYAARVQIRRRQNIHAGVVLTRWGIWLSVLFGLGYGSFLLATEWAVRLQAQAFTDVWFDSLRQGDVNAAFLLTIPASQRQGDTPDDLPRLRARYGLGRTGQKGPLPLFLEHPLIQLLRHAGATAKIESLGIRDWKYVGNGYLVEQEYRVTTPEGVFDVVLPVWGGPAPGSDPQARGRQWHVIMSDLQLDVQVGLQQRARTALGEAMQTLRHSGERFVLAWGRKLSEGQLREPELEIRSDQLFAVSDAARKTIGNMAREMLGQAPKPGQLLLEIPQEEPQFAVSPYSLEAEELRLTLPMTLQLAGRYQCEGTVTIATREPALLQQLRLMQAGQAGSEVGEEHPWRVVRIELRFGSDQGG